MATIKWGICGAIIIGLVYACLGVDLTTSDPPDPGNPELEACYSVAREWAAEGKGDLDVLLDTCDRTYG